MKIWHSSCHRKITRQTLKNHEAEIPLLAADNLYHTYPGGETAALQGVGFSLKAGDLCGLIGPNGAGKTTLLSIFTTLLKPDRGTVRICGENAIQTPQAIRRVIGYVPQDLAIYGQLTGMENILFFGCMYGLEKTVLRQRAEFYLDMFGLYDKADRRVGTYSGGMKRRINLIIGIIHEPRLLFLDEPTVGIDAHSRHLIIEKLAQLNRKEMATIYTSHYMEEVEQLCSRIIIIDGGRIIADGSSNTLLARHDDCDSLSELYLKKTGVQLRD